MTELLRPYVPRPVVDWLRETPDALHRRVRGSLVFADISGFTTLTEKLSQQGKAGAEEMGDLLNSTFEQLLVPAYDHGATLLKWGGDAALLLFEDTGHAQRACTAAHAMQHVLGQIGTLRTTSGNVRLRMSIGVHAGAIDLFLVGTSHRELLVLGDAATEVTRTEQLARAGEVLLSRAAAGELEPAVLGAAREGGLLLTRSPQAPPRPQTTRPIDDGLDLLVALPTGLRDHLQDRMRDGAADSEHRHVVTGFVQFLGTDSLLAERGPAAVAAALTDVIDTTAAAAERHGVAFLASDVALDGGKLILASGVPRSHDRLEERMLCALRDVMDAPLRVRLRAGVTGGRVFAGDFGPSYRRTYSVVGDAVNLAARLMGKAEPGQILATPEVCERSRTAFETFPLQPFHVKGKSHAIAAVLVGAPATRSNARQRSARPLIGRNAQRELLDDCLSRAARGDGVVVQIVGDSGLGKSRVLEHLTSNGKGFRVLSAQCDAYDASTPYRPWRQLLQQLLGLSDGAADLAERLRQVVTERCPRLMPWLPLVGDVLDVPVNMTAEVANLDERFRRRHLATTVTELLDAAVDTPLLLAVDDVHLADDASAELLKSVAADVRERRWVLAVTRRAVSSGYVPANGTHLIGVELGPLDDGSCAQLLEVMTDAEPLAPHVARELIDRAGGNPLFLGELLAAHRRLGATEALPETLEDIFSSAIDSLPADARWLLRTAAVLGMSFPQALLDHVLAGSGRDVEVATWRHLDQFLLRHGTTLRFRTALLRETAYEALPYRRRLQLHGIAGEVIEAGPMRDTHDGLAAMSMHFFNARRFERAVHYSRLAGERARAQYANVEATVFYGRALQAIRALRASGPVAREVAQVLGDVWYALGDLSNAEASYAEARRHAAGDPLSLGRLWLQTARVRRRAGRTPLALRCLSRGLTHVDGLPEREARALAGELCAVYAQVRQEQGHNRDAVRWARRAIETASEVGARDVLAHAYQYLDLADISMGRDEHEELIHEALAIWEDLGERTRQAALLNHLGIRAYYRGDWPAALSYYTRAHTALERVGDHWNAAIAAINIVEISIDQGRVQEAHDLARQCLRVFRAAGTPSTIAHITGFLGRIAVREERYDDAGSLFQEARELFVQSGDQAGIADCDARLLEVLVLQGYPEEAALRCQETLTRLRGSQMRVVLPLLERVRGRALFELGKQDEAVEALHLSLEQARAMNLRPDVAAALDALLLVAERRGEAAPDDVVQERDELFAQLGITFGRASQPHIVVPSQPRVVADVLPAG